MITSTDARPHFRGRFATRRRPRGGPAGNPARRVVEFARLRGARLVVLGSRRSRLGRSVSRNVIRDADRPVLVPGRTAPVTA